MAHIPVLLTEVISFLPSTNTGELLDVTAGGGGHFFSLLKEKSLWKGLCWDRDPLAKQRIEVAGRGFEGRYTFEQKEFSLGGEEALEGRFSYILADLGISSFQLDDPERGMSFFSNAPVDFRMNPLRGEPFYLWLPKKSLKELEEILIKYGEENKAKKIATILHSLKFEADFSAKEFAELLMKEAGMRLKKGEAHPLTRTFQALRIAVNSELDELAAFLLWAPKALTLGGRLAIISFHSLEDRKVKRVFQSLEQEGAFKILTSKALTPKEEEVELNFRSRSAKLRVLERVK